MYEKSLFNVNAFHNKCFNFLKLFLYFFLFKVEKYFQNYVLCLFYIFVLFFQFESIAFNLNNFIYYNFIYYNIINIYFNISRITCF